MIEVRDRIKRVRKQLKHTQTEFGKLLGLTHQSDMSKIERGIKPIHAELLVRMVMEFNVNPEFLLEGKGRLFKSVEETGSTTNGISLPSVQDVSKDYKSIEAFYDYRNIMKELVDLRNRMDKVERERDLS